MIEKLAILVAALLFVSLSYVALVSLVDGEKRAALVGVILAMVTPAPFLLVGLLDFPFQPQLTIASLTATAVLAISLLLPTRSPNVWKNDTPKTRIDERDIMFSRALLEPGTNRFDEYYERNPEKKLWDDRFRCRPGLLGEGAAFFNPLTFRAADASFETIEQLRPHVNGPVSPEVVGVAPADITRFLQGWAKKLGAHAVGVTKLRDYHLYSAVGRGLDYGSSVEREHDYAIAMTVEMDKGMLDSGPSGPTVMESAQKYVKSGVIAVQLAHFIRSLGYSARAHIDGNYRVVCPLVARDAGLGEIGRMGLLMTPELGPRVRLAVVTTSLTLQTGLRIPDDSVLDFCTVCRKCATSCPPWAISFDDRKEIDGVSRWQINQELCYIYWSHTGTDCGRCVAVCPYSHPDRVVHRFVRWGVRRSRMFRRVAIVSDRIFYGKKPRPAPVQKWMEVGGVEL